MDIGLINLSTNESSLEELSFGMGNNPPKFSDLNKLVQLVVITLMTDAGSDKFDEYGAGLASLLGKNINANDLTDVKSAITHMIIETERQILAEQEEYSYPTSERLSRIDLLDIRLNSLYELEIDINIINEDDDKAFVRL